MSDRRWWWFGAEGPPQEIAPPLPPPPPLNRILPTDQRLMCDCGDDRPMEPILALNSFAIRDVDGQRVVISEMNGVTAKCHQCGAITDFGPRGKFRPAMYNRPAPMPRENQGPDPAAMLNPPPIMRTPVQRPNV